MKQKRRAVLATLLFCGTLATPNAHAITGDSFIFEGEGKSVADIPDASNNDPFGNATFAEKSSPHDPWNKCRLTIWDVSQDDATNWLGVQGGRYDCDHYATFTVQLKKVVDWRPDKVLAEEKSGGNGVVRAFSVCDGPGSYFGRIKSSFGTTVDGDRSYRCS